MKVLNILLVLFVSQYIMLFVAADKDLTCKAGEAVASGEIFTSGLASQCSGISKITTEAECKLAAEYNSKNNIDKNDGYGGRDYYSGFPPGCFYFSYKINKYIWIINNCKNVVYYYSNI